jgi:hypothetical protein
MVGALFMHGRHAIIPLSTWWAVTWARWGTDLSQLRVELVNGPKMKFAAHKLLYIFCLVTMVIRIVD